MKYWCNICKKEITEKVFKYSKDVFGRPLCLYHQNIERQKERSRNPKKVINTPPVIEQNNVESKILSKSIETSNTEIGKKKQKSFFTKARNWIQNKRFNSEKKSKIRKWKSKILRRMSQYQLNKICSENKISTKKTVVKMSDDDDDSLFYFTKEKCTRDELISRIRKKLSLDEIISYAKRGRINIQDIRNEIENTLSEWEIRELKRKAKQDNYDAILDEIECTIRRFKPFRRYEREYGYQDTLAAFLKSQYPNTRIEESRGSTRPDIYVNGIAIEVKGPTYDKDLQTIADKCLRYPQYFPRGLICTLFDVKVSKKRYEDWLKGMKMKFPDVRIIRIDV
ncbi:MAG: hypothetical protein ACTSRP_10805 [Candidatus Helarchaeota archaeon]